jgi:hypothetical protein
MNRKKSTFLSRRQRRDRLTAPVIVLAIVLLAGPLLTPVLAGPTQEKGQEEPKEKKEKPKVFTNKDLKKGSSPSSGGDEAPAETADGAGPGDESAETPADQEDPWATVGVATDSQGRGEEYWRQAMSDARGAVAAAKAERDRLQSEMNRSRVDFTAIDDPAARALVDARIQELFGLLEEADQTVADAEQALRDLEEDARRSGALPGWLR